MLKSNQKSTDNQENKIRFKVILEKVEYSCKLSGKFVNIQLRAIQFKKPKFPKSSLEFPRNSRIFSEIFACQGEHYERFEDFNNFMKFLIKIVEFDF